MSEYKGGSFSTLQHVFHPAFELQNFRSLFIKASWKVYTDMQTKPVSTDRFQTIMSPFFDALFSSDDMSLATSSDDLHELFSVPNDIALFVTDTFYILLNQYIRSCYGQLDCWEKIIDFTSAAQYTINQMTKRIDDETFYLFEDMLINTLEEMRLDKNPITVLNTYLGIPIQYPATIVHTDTQSVIIKPHPLQESAAILQNGIYMLKNEHISHDVFADVRPIELDGHQYLRLSRFDKLQTSLFHRQNIRVQPARAYSMSITHHSLNLRCQLFDLSLGGIALTSKLQFSIPMNSEVVLHLPLEITDDECDITGTLVYKSSYEGGYKYHFKMMLTLQQESDLSRFITQREKEIIKQLREQIA